MQNRYEEVTRNVMDTLRQVKEDHFPELQGAEILCVFDTKKKMTKGKLELASIRACNELQKFLSSDETGSEEGFDYIIRIDKKAWHCASDQNKVRLMRHELRHTNIDTDNTNKPWKLRGHSIEDFFMIGVTKPISLEESISSTASGS